MIFEKIYKKKLEKSDNERLEIIKADMIRSIEKWKSDIVDMESRFEEIANRRLKSNYDVHYRLK